MKRIFLILVLFMSVSLSLIANGSSGSMTMVEGCNLLIVARDVDNNTVLKNATIKELPHTGSDERWNVNYESDGAIRLSNISTPGTYELIIICDGYQNYVLILTVLTEGEGGAYAFVAKMRKNPSTRFGQNLFEDPAISLFMKGSLLAIKED